MSISSINFEQNVHINTLKNDDKNIYASNDKIQVSNLPNDTVEISTKKDKKWGRFAFCVGALILAGIGAIRSYKNYYIKKAQKAFQEIFMRDDITKAETKNMLIRYSDIMKIKEKKEFLNALFDEAKANYGFKNGSLKLKTFTKEEYPNKGGFVKSGDANVHIKIDCSKKDMLDYVHHELRHKKQEFIECNYCADNMAEYVDAITHRFHIKSEGHASAMEVLKDNPEYLRQFNISKYDKSYLRSKDISYAKKLLEAEKTYEEGSIVSGKINSQYYDNFKEVDARFAGDTMKKLLGNVFLSLISK